MKKIIILNAGSSSLKYKLYDLSGQGLALDKSGEINSIGLPDGPKNHKIALDLIFQGFGHSKGFLSDIPSLIAIGHRVVYGGQKYSKPTLVTEQLIASLKEFNQLAPLHNPPILEVMQTVLHASREKVHRHVANYAVFDTMFYQDLPELAKVYALPYEYYEKKGIERFGFHGISHKNTFRQAQKKYRRVDKMISIHLGAGASITAIKNGRAIETSMGFTPQEGLIMSTRCGDIDAGIITYLMREYKLNETQISRILNHESGILGVSNISSDMRDILYVAGYEVEDSNYEPSGTIQTMPEIYTKKAKFTIDLYAYRIKKYIGAYYALLGGLDILAFTGKIGYGSSVIRQKITQGLNHILKNAKIIRVLPDEELQIAEEIKKLID